VAWVRKLPSGLWAATVRTPVGRITESFTLRSHARTWADDQETQVRRGDWIDPRRAEVTVGEWWERVRDARHLEKASRARDESHWRCHVAPKWSRVPVGVILKPDIDAWVVAMHKAKTGAATIEGAVGVLRALLQQAVDAGIIRANPVVGVKKPRRKTHVDRVLSAADERLLLARLDELFPGRPDARLFVEGLLETGARWEELAAVRREAVDLRRRRVQLGPVVERDGSIRPYPKTESGERAVPVSDVYLSLLRTRIVAVPAGGLLFTAPRGGVLLYPTWRARVWVPALFGPGRTRYLADPQPTPHDLRHTFGTRLGDGGVPQHEIAALLGHGDLKSTARYVHAGEDRHDRARQALSRARSS
jgi:integrase